LIHDCQIEHGVHDFSERDFFGICRNLYLVYAMNLAHRASFSTS